MSEHSRGTLGDRKRSWRTGYDDVTHPYPFTTVSNLGISPSQYGAMSEPDRCCPRRVLRGTYKVLSWDIGRVQPPPSYYPLRQSLVRIMGSHPGHTSNLRSGNPNASMHTQGQGGRPRVRSSWLSDFADTFDWVHRR